MHQRGYAHRDIKPENLLFSEAFTLKLADFGFSSPVRGRSGCGALRTRLGTKGYMAPEIGSKHYDGRKTDIFAAGVVLFVMYAGGPPFEGTVGDPFYSLIRERRFAFFWKAHARRRPPSFFSEAFKDLLQRMLAFDPGERPTTFQIAEHPWLDGPVCLPLEIAAEFSLRRERL